MHSRLPFVFLSLLVIKHRRRELETVFEIRRPLLGWHLSRSIYEATRPGQLVIVTGE